MMVSVKEILIDLRFVNKRGSYYFFASHEDSPHYPISLSFHKDEYKSLGKPEIVEVAIKPGKD